MSTTKVKPTKPKNLKDFNTGRDLTKPKDKAKVQRAKEKFEIRKENDETVIKSCLRGKLCGDEKQRKQIMNIIETCVYNCSKATVNTSILINLMIKKAFHDKNLVSDDIIIPDFLDQTFIRQMMLGNDKAKKPYDEISKLMIEYPKLFNTVRHPGDKQIFTSASRKLQTNLTNHLVLNFPKVIKRYIYDVNKSNLTKDEKIECLYRINGWKRNKKLPPEPEIKVSLTVNKSENVKLNLNIKNDYIERLYLDLIVDDKTEYVNSSLTMGGKFIINEKRVSHVVNYVRKVLSLEDGQVITDDWIKENKLTAVLKAFIMVNRSLEMMNLNKKPEDKEVVLFNILPICGIKAHFITIDTTCLHGLLNGAKIIKCTEKAFMELKEDHWNSIFNIKSNKGIYKNKVFTGTIDTDGVAINIHYYRPQNNNKTTVHSNKQESLEGKRVLGLDPGRTNIYYIVEELADGSFKSYKLTRAQYYQESGINKAIKQSKIWLERIKHLQDILSTVSSKGASKDTFIRYIETITPIMDQLFKVHFCKCWRNQRLRLYGGKKRVFANFFNKLLNPEDDRETVIAYGSAKFTSSGKNEVAVPTSRAFKEASYRFPTIVVGEFRTTRVYHKDDSLLQAVGKFRMSTKDGCPTGKTSQRVKVRGLLWCNSTNVSTNKPINKFIDRDLNAAINIRRCAILPKRPEILVRKNNDRLPPLRIGKMIF